MDGEQIEQLKTQLETEQAKNKSWENRYNDLRAQRDNEAKTDYNVMKLQNQMHLIIATVEELTKKQIDKSKEASVQVVELIKSLHEQKLSCTAKLE